MKKKGKSKQGISLEQTQSKKEPRIVSEINESDDEEIDEDEAFNSDDERKYGSFFAKNQSDDDGEKEGDEEEGTGSDDNDDDSDDGDGDDGDEDEAEDDGGQYMLELLKKIDSSKSDKNKHGDKEVLSIKQMAKLQESEFSSSISTKGLTLDNLMEGLQDTQGFSKLQKTFKKQGSATPAPLAKVIADRTQRKMIYEEQSKDISGWTKAVQENRQAETLDFKPKQRLEVTRDTLVSNFEPTTEFEKELERALEEAGQQDDEAILKAEEALLQDDLGANRLTMEEYKKRRGQLAQMRALLLYHEQKRHHINKIKSKKYRRIRKKQREKLKDAEMQAAVEDDEDLAKELKEKEEVSRIQERMTLAHKNTSKWAQRILKRGKNVDVDTRRALSAQLKRGEDLRKKMMGEDHESGDDSDEEDLVESARKVLAETSEENDPTRGKTGLFKLSFMQKGITKLREQAREEARKLLEELEANERDDYDDVVEADDCHASPKEEGKVASASEMSQVLKNGELVAKSLELGNSSSIAMSGGIEIDMQSEEDADNHGEKEAATMPSRKPFRSSTTEHISILAAQDTGKNESSIMEIKTQESNKKRKKEAPAAAPAPAPAPARAVTTKQDSEANPWMALKVDAETPAAENSHNKKNKRGLNKTGIVDVEGAATILDTEDSNINFMSGKIQEANKILEQPAVDQEKKKISSLTQEELVRRAFTTASEKELEEEFQKEKEEQAAKDDPTRKKLNEQASDEVEGWGSWAGTGVLSLSLKKKRELPKKLQAPKKKEEPKRKRIDDHKPNVIINAKRIKKTANNFMVGEIPYPYSSRVEYEQAMMGAVGKEWNATKSFKNMTRPEILTRSGKIIKPISKKVKQVRPAAKF